MPVEVPTKMANGLARATSVTVDSATATLQDEVAVGHGPIADIALDGHTLVVTNFGDHTVAVLDARDLTVKGGLTAREPFALAVSGQKAYVGVASIAYDAIAVVNPDNNAGWTLSDEPGDKSGVQWASNGLRILYTRKLGSVSSACARGTSAMGVRRTGDWADPQSRAHATSPPRVSWSSHSRL